MWHAAAPTVDGRPITGVRRGSDRKPGADPHRVRRSDTGRFARIHVPVGCRLIGSVGSQMVAPAVQRSGPSPSPAERPPGVLVAQQPRRPGPTHPRSRDRPFLPSARVRPRLCRCWEQTRIYLTASQCRARRHLPADCPDSPGVSLQRSGVGHPSFRRSTPAGPPVCPLTAPLSGSTVSLVWLAPPRVWTLHNGSNAGTVAEPSHPLT